MKRWNMFSEEVREERRRVRAYGVSNIMNKVPELDSYKGQALRQLAMRLELEEALKDLQADYNKLIDQNESLELQLDIERTKNRASI